MPNCIDCNRPLTGHGKPTRCRSCAKQGSLHPLWQGDEIGYAAAHHRVKRQRGLASEYQCVECQEPATDWSYDEADPNERVDDKGKRFSLDPNHYVPHCHTHNMTTTRKAK